MSEETKDAAPAEGGSDDAAHDSHEHKGPSYLNVFWALCFLTAAEVIVALEGVRAIVGYKLMVTSLLIMAFTKAALVAMYFMHVALDDKKLRIVVLSPIGLSMLLFIAPIMEVYFSK